MLGGQAIVFCFILMERHLWLIHLKLLMENMGKKQVVDFGGNSFGHNESGFCVSVYLSLH